VLTSPGAKAITAPQERCLIDLMQDGDHRALDPFIFQGAPPEGPCPTAGRHTIPSAHGLCPLGPLMHPSMQVRKPRLQVLPIPFPRHSVHPWSRVPLERDGRLPQAVPREVVAERGQPLGWMLTNRLPYTTHPLGHARPALRPVRVVWRRMPLGHRPSLPLLRRPTGSVVRRVLRYYVGV
jgi:hypothetical protein